MICGFCAREIPEETGQAESCGACPGGCRKVHCPWCGYANPAVPAILKKWMNKQDKREDES